MPNNFIPQDITSFFVAIAFLVITILIFGRLRGLKLITREQLKRDIDEKNRALIASRRLNKIILESLDFNEIVQKIADTIPHELYFGTGVVAVVDEFRGTIRRIAASQTKEAAEAIKAIKVPFKQIEISLTDKENLMVKCVKEKKSFITSDVYDVLGPVLSRFEAQEVQRIMGTRTTLVYPILGSKDRAIGVFLASAKKDERNLSQYELEMIQNFVDGVGIAMEHALIYQQVKNITQKLEDANVRLKQLDQLKDDFVSIASHELRTPMTAIRSYAWMALHKSDVPLSEKLEKYLIRVLLSTERLINLVNDMLNVSRIESGKIEITPEPVDLHALVKDIVDELYYSKSQEKQINFVILEKQVPKVFADPDKLRQVFLNLVGNSLKFTPHGGKIIFDFFTDGLVVETSVTDTGVGISKEDLGRLFHKFSRLDNSYTAAATSGGTGLGLYISKHLVELMHGKISVVSEGAGKGTTFTVSLPVATKDKIEHASEYAIKPKEGEAKPLEPVTI